MPWVRFTENFDWQPPDAKWMIAFKKGTTKLVKHAVAEKAISEGKAVPAMRPVHPVTPEKQNASG